MGEPRVLHVSEQGQQILGIATTSSHLYIVRYLADHVEVLDREKFNVTSKINIPGLTDACGLAVCEHNNCLYVSDSGSIRRVDLSNKAITNWAVMLGRLLLYISLTRKHNLLVTEWDIDHDMRI